MAKSPDQNIRRIMGIDPGLAITGYAIIDSNGRTHKLVCADYIKTNSKELRADRLHYIYKNISDLMFLYKPIELAIESQFVSINVKAAISVAEARTVSSLAASMQDINIFTFAPTEVKESVTGYGRASKQQVFEMVQMLIELDNIRLQYDITDAIAIALTRISEWKYL